MKKLLVTTVLGLAMVLGSASFALAANTTEDLPPVGAYPGSALYDPATDLPDGDVADNDIGNANVTGKNVNIDDGTAKNDVIKSDSMTWKFNADGTGPVTGDVTQRTHGEYQTNTNSCASCHQTHTGAGDKLLFKNGVYNTCTACHDGTLGFYNVFEPSTAGTFGGTESGNASVHMATGTMKTKAAPGGNTEADSTDVFGEHNWESEFTCSSCHAPHGSYSDRLLSYNPNHAASVTTDLGGQLVRTDVIVTTLPDADAVDAPEWVVYETTANTVLTAEELTKYSSSTKAADKIAGTDKIAVVMKKKENANHTHSYVRDTQPWINGGEYKHDHSYKVAFTKFYQGVAPDLETDAVTQPNLSVTGLTWFYSGGFAKLGDLKLAETKINGVVTNPAVDITNTLVNPVLVSDNTTPVVLNADISRAYTTKLVMDDTVAWFGAPNTGVKITQVKPDQYDKNGEGIAISTFCAACHTDYMGGSDDPVAAGGTGGTGVYSTAYRHSTDSDNYTCLKCHFAHGSDVTIMLDAQSRDIADVAAQFYPGDPDATVKATAYMLDKNPSSALKRYTNMSVCWKCHTSSHNVMLMNNAYVNNVKYDAETDNDLTSGFQHPANNTLPYWQDLTKQPKPIIP